jgi:tetratricopeptide (TPR) repeat protein
LHRARGSNYEQRVNAYPSVYEVASYARALQAECLLRYPKSDNLEKMLWDLTNIDPVGVPLPGMRPGESLFAFLLEALYTRGDIPSHEALTQTLETESLMTWVADSIYVTGLFGDGQEALVITLLKHPVDYTGVCATLAIHPVGSQVRVETLQDWAACDWGSVTNYFSLPGAADTNGNGLPEVIVSSETGASGFPQHWTQHIYLYEWDPSKEAFTDTDIPVFSQACDRGPCAGQYEIGAPDAHGYRPITVSAYWYTDGAPYRDPKSKDPEPCPTLEVRRTYRWDGKQYAAGEDELVPPPDRPECRIAWADQVIYRYGWQNDQAIQILSEALENWPEAMNTRWGPASRDYFRLRLGIWQELRGEASAALRRLQDLVDQPTDPQYDLPARLAAEYLGARSQAGIAAACYQAGQTWRAEAQAVYDTLENAYEIDGLIARWGFAHPGWFGGFGLNIDDLCTLDEALEVGAPTLWAVSTANLKNWLEIMGVQVLAVKPVDLDGNGQTDWLALIHTERGGGSTYLWAFVRTPHGLKASLVDGFWNNYIDFTLRSYRPEKGAPLVQLFQLDDSLSIFYFDANKAPEMLGGQNYVVGHWVDERPEGSQLVVYTRPIYQQPEVYTYTWNADTHRMDEHTFGYDYDASETEAERLLFQAMDYEAAIEAIQQFLREAPPEVIDCRGYYNEGCHASPEWYVPYMRYLLALAYDLDGQAEKALQGYFLLWRDYPTHLFGMVARLKLEPSAP